MKRYFDLSTEQKLALSYSELELSIQIEAAERGIAIPITLDEALKNGAYTSYCIPADSTALYEVMLPSRYGNPESSGLCFKSEQEAESAINGAMAVKKEGYTPNERNVIITGEFSVRKVWISLRKQIAGAVKFSEFEPDLEAYEALVTEINEDLSTLRQREYDSKVTATKKEKYLGLANGDEEIAKRFWSNIEGTEWPA